MYTSVKTSNFNFIQFKNQFASLSTRENKLKSIILNKKLGKLNNFENIYNHLLFYNFLKPLVSEIESKSGFTFTCLECEIVYDIPLFNNCINCNSEITVIKEDGELKESFNLISSLVKEISKFEINPLNKDLLKYIELKLY